MSTSYNGTPTSLPKEVASFVYRDSAGPGHSSEPLPSLLVTEQGEQTPEPADNLRHISQEELSRLITEARTEGFRDGEGHARSAFDKELSSLRIQIGDQISDFQRKRAQYFANVEVELVQFALAIAARILHREAQVDRMVVAGLVKVTIEKLQQGTKVVLRVRPEEASKWRHHFQENQNLQVTEDSTVDPGGCFLETELGTADMGLDAQLKEVEKGFFDLLAQRPGSP
jgi:flagellar assembly protein FliH